MPYHFFLLSAGMSWLNDLIQINDKKFTRGIDNKIKYTLIIALDHNKTTLNVALGV